MYADIWELINLIININQNMDIKNIDIENV